MIPQAARLLVDSCNKPNPKIISAKPAILLRSLGLGRYGGIILRYTFGFTKCMMPAITYSVAIMYKKKSFIKF